MINDAYRKNFDSLSRAFDNGDVCLMECIDVHTGKPVITICAVSFDGEEYTMTPFAKLFDGNPYEELIPPMEERQ